MAGLQGYNEITGGHFNHVVPMVPLPDGRLFYKNCQEREPAAPRPNPPNPQNPPNPEFVIDDLPNGWCPGVHEDCNHLPGIPPESCGNSMMPLFR